MRPSGIFVRQFPHSRQIQIKTANVPPTEFCGHQSKMYSLTTLTGAKTFFKAKHVPKLYVKNNVRHEQYLHVLRHWNHTSCKFMFSGCRIIALLRANCAKSVCRVSTTSAIFRPMQYIQLPTVTEIFHLCCLSIVSNCINIIMIIIGLKRITRCCVSCTAWCTRARAGLPEVTLPLNYNNRGGMGMDKMHAMAMRQSV